MTPKGCEIYLAEGIKLTEKEHMEGANPFNGLPRGMFGEYDMTAIPPCFKYNYKWPKPKSKKKRAERHPVEVAYCTGQEFVDYINQHRDENSWLDTIADIVEALINEPNPAEEYYVVFQLFGAE